MKDIIAQPGLVVLSFLLVSAALVIMRPRGSGPDELAGVFVENADDPDNWSLDNGPDLEEDHTPDLVSEGRHPPGAFEFLAVLVLVLIVIAEIVN